MKSLFGFRLRHLRLKAGLTQLELAEMANISDRYLGRVERGLASPSFESIGKIARALHIAPYELFLFHGQNTLVHELPEEEAGWKNAHHEASSTHGERETTVERQLLQTSQRLEHLLASNPAILYVCDARQGNRTTYVSDSVFGVLGLKPESLLGDLEKWTSHMHPGEKERILTLLPEISVKGELVVEYRMRHADGGWRWLRDHMRLTRGADGHPDELIGCCLDITEAKASELAMRDSQSRYQTLFETNRTVQLLIDAETGSILDANPAAVDFYGYSRERLTSMNIGDINTLPADELDQAPGQARQADTYVFLFQHRLANGQLRQVESRVSPMRLGSRTVLHSMIVDVTARNKAEEELRRATHTLQAAFEHGPHPLALLDKDLRVLRCNKHMEGLLGGPTGEVLGHTCRLSPVPRQAPGETSMVTLEVAGEHNGVPSVLTRIPVDGDEAGPYLLICYASPTLPGHAGQA